MKAQIRFIYARKVTPWQSLDIANRDDMRCLNLAIEDQLEKYPKGSKIEFRKHQKEKK